MGRAGSQTLIQIIKWHQSGVKAAVNNTSNATELRQYVAGALTRAVNAEEASNSGLLKVFTYVDETELTANGYNAQIGSASQLLSQESSPSQESVEYDTVSDCRLYHSTPDGLSSIVSAPLASHQQYAAAVSPSNKLLVHGDDALQSEVLPIDTSHSSSDGRESSSNAADAGSDVGSTGGASLQLPSLYLPEPVWPLNSASEAMLFRHFTHSLAPWLDLCDPLSVFQTVVPRRAGTCPVLLNAIFALAARHLSHTTGYDHFAANRYHDMCLNSLIPLLQHGVGFSDENLFAATIILRVLEEMEVRNMGVDTKGYLLSIHKFVGHGDRYIAPHSLSAAAFWVGLRQEIYSAVMNHQPVRVNLEIPIVDRSLEPTDDDATWANRAVTYCADVLNFCFSQDYDVSPSPGSGSGDRVTGASSGTFSTTERWHRLSEWGRAWQMSLPKSFVPILDKKRSEKEAFPEVWYQTSCQIIGIQHHILAELFLTRFDPKIPRIGGQRKSATRRMTHHIQHLVRRLCGIGLHNEWSPPALFTACMGVAAFGDRFDNRKDQDALLEILTRTSRDHARPTESVQKQMMESWGWIADDDDDNNNENDNE
ncbi:uncharacterized protein PgNI_01502 [Pyricularia grisea]|uniref:ARCA protein n=1 Tax=Pyricularia grisea TaxID=148305 RepID=A0A6P8BM49_PYRGI|nr:uncharacterized protein PgNI_01502 [Pyricularia grisea]TLD17667.1 hypothetical protein PgNI_01502 [Pyricularia grisea]